MSDNTKTEENTVNNVDNFFNTLQSYEETDSRGIGIESSISGNDSIKTTYTIIPTPAWFPDSFLRSLKRNSYFNMVNSAAYLSGKDISLENANTGNSLDFYKETNDGIKGLVKNVAKSILSTSANQLVSIISKVDSLINGVKSLFGDDDEVSGSSDTPSTDPFLAAQPYMNVYGIHVTESLRDLTSSLQTIFGRVTAMVGKTLWDSLKSGKITEDAFSKKFDGVLAEAIKKFLKWDSQDTSGTLSDIFERMMTNPKLRMHGVAEALLNSVVSGTYTMQCKLPYFYGNVSPTPMIQSSGADGFMGLNMSISNNLIHETIRNTTGLNFVWSHPIEWSTENLKSHIPVELSFVIFNDTLEHAITNLFFIWSFGAVSKAVTDSFFVRPPYLFNIEVPGGFRYKYCKCEFAATPIGKLRRLETYTTDGNGVAEDNVISDIFNSVFNYNVNPKAVEYIPDAYNISITFTSILPDLWNFMDSYLHNRGMDEPAMGNRIQGKLASLINSFDEKK